MNGAFRAALIAAVAASCANGQAVKPDGGGPPPTDGGPTTDGTIADAPLDVPVDACALDTDKDGVADCNDKCPGTAANAKVNLVGCSDAQVTPKLNPNWPPYGMTWTPTGDLGRTGGLVWTYTGIQRGDLFHIDWIVCDDPKEPCGLSLDGPIDVPGEKWTYSATDSDLPNGKLVLTNTTGILLWDNSTTPLTGRLTLTIVDDSNAPIPFTTIASLGVTAQDGQYGAEIKGTGFKVTAIAEVKDAQGTWTPYLDYFDAAPTPPSDAGLDAGDLVYVSYGGSFYDD